MWSISRISVDALVVGGVQAGRQLVLGQDCKGNILSQPDDIHELTIEHFLAEFRPNSEWHCVGLHQSPELGIDSLILFKSEDLFVVHPEAHGRGQLRPDYFVYIHILGLPISNWDHPNHIEKWNFCGISEIRKVQINL